MSQVSTKPAYTFPDNTIQYSACPSIQTGVTSVQYGFLNGTVNNNSNIRTIYFPYTFNTTPQVILTSVISTITSGSNFGCCYWINNITTSAFEISAVNAYNSSTANNINVIFNWVAMGT